MADKLIRFTKSIVAQKDISEGGNTVYITQLSKPIMLRGISTKTCQNVLYSIDGMNFTEESTIGGNDVLSMAIVPFQIGGATINSAASGPLKRSMYIKAFSYILAGRNINEDINIQNPISASTNVNGNGAYRYLLQYLAKNQDKIEWNTGDLFLSLDPDRQDTFGGSDFITDAISVRGGEDKYQLSIDKQEDANGSILKPAIFMPTDMSSNVIAIQQHPYFFLYPEACPPSDGKPDKLIMDNFWRGGGLLATYNSSIYAKGSLILYIFGVA